MIRKTIVLVVFIASFLITNTSFARIYIPIDQPADQKFPIAIADLVKLKGSGVRSATKKIPDVIRNDLELTGYFQVVPKRAYLDKSKDISADTIDFAKWTKVGALALVKGAIQNVDGKIIVQLKLFDTKDREMLVGKQYTFEVKDMRKIAHRFADEIMLATTGIRGVFGTRIAYIGITGKRSKSVYVMDMDGENAKRLTKDKSISLGPTWSPDGLKLAYSSYVRGFPDIYEMNLANGRKRQLTANRSTNITPAWSPLGTWIAYASSAPGNMEIYIMTPEGENNRRISNSFGIDLAPTFSPDGNQILYSSERSGALHIYKQSIMGGKPERITYVGSFNDSPSWSPDGQTVAFAGRMGGLYDIYTVNIDGSNVQRLTISSGNNEHPRWSPDGRFLTFSSTRMGKPYIFMMRYDGANQIMISKKKGKKYQALMPDWGPWTD